MKKFKVTIPYRLEVEMIVSLPDEDFDKYSQSIRHEIDDDSKHPAISKALRMADKFGDFYFQTEMPPPSMANDPPMAAKFLTVDDPELPGEYLNFFLEFDDYEVLEENSIVVEKV